MINIIDALQIRLQRARAGEVSYNQVRSEIYDRSPRIVQKKLLLAPRQIVHNANVMTLTNQALNEIRADHSGAACNQKTLHNFGLVLAATGLSITIDGQACVEVHAFHSL